MEKQHIKKRIEALIYLHFDETVDKLQISNTDAFIHHMALLQEKALKEWQLKVKTSKLFFYKK